MSFKVGDTVVYPHHGAARIEEIETRSIKGEEKSYLVLKVDKGDLTVRVPADNAELVGVRDVVAQHLEHPLQPFLPDHIPYAHKLGIVRGDAYREVALVDLEHEVRLFLTLDRTGLDLFDPSSPMMGVDDSVADLERHVACTPSAEAMLPRRTGAISRRFRQTRRSVTQFTLFKFDWARAAAAPGARRANGLPGTLRPARDSIAPATTTGRGQRAPAAG